MIFSPQDDEVIVVSDCFLLQTRAGYVMGVLEMGHSVATIQCLGFVCTAVDVSFVLDDLPIFQRLFS